MPPSRPTTGTGTPVASAPVMEPTAVLRPVVKWPGGKSRELGTIARTAPPLSGRYIDPFVGGGSVLLAVPWTVPALANDTCPEVIALYSGIAASDSALHEALTGVALAWEGLSLARSPVDELAGLYRRAAAPERLAAACEDLVTAVAPRLEQAGPLLAGTFSTRLLADVSGKIERMRRVEAKAGHALDDTDLRANIEGAVRAVFYLSVRSRYNAARLAGSWNAWRIADFLLLRELAYAAMFRFNSRGEFNVPYGGVTYNRKSLRNKLEGAYSPAMVRRLGRTEWHSRDFEGFLEAVAPAGDDFVFVDPPYDSDFSEYDNRAFAADDQVRLEGALRGLDCPVMIVIKDSARIRGLYATDHWHMSSADKTYAWTIKSRNDRSAVHLTITNY